MQFNGSRLAYIISVSLKGMYPNCKTYKGQPGVKVKENLQTIVWVIGSITLVISMGIAWFVWRISKRDSNNKKSKKNHS